MKAKLIIILSIIWMSVTAQTAKDIPVIYSNINWVDGELVFQPEGSTDKLVYYPSAPKYYFDKIAITPEGTENGLRF